MKREIDVIIRSWREIHVIAFAMTQNAHSTFSVRHHVVVLLRLDVGATTSSRCE
jgi:hypothetical protein